ncbi:MAG: chemotaxis protein, partial [Caenispirillum sp.]|nr:chemotaxis protein [Caenispirillum sp.]
MSSTTDQQIANLSAAMLAMAGELRGIVKQSVQEAVREEIARLMESGALIPAGAAATAAPAAEPP